LDQNPDKKSLIPLEVHQKSVEWMQAYISYACASQLPKIRFQILGVFLPSGGFVMRTGSKSICTLLTLISLLVSLAGGAVTYTP